MYEIKGNWFVRLSSSVLIYLTFMVGYGILLGFIAVTLNMMFSGIFVPAFTNSLAAILVIIGVCAIFVVYATIFEHLFFRFIRCAEKQLNRKIEVRRNKFYRY